ncbi:MAG TPA: integrase arm-type DNA-binding domain-containing protein [Allosphingosinicella sp.]|jgi:integrase
MASVNLLNDRKVTSLKAGSKPGLYADGSNLYLRLTETGAKSWIFRYSANGKVRQLGLGSYPARSLKAAREVAADMRAALASGDDPATILKPKHDPAAMTFRLYAADFIEAKRREFSNGKHAAQWPSTLERYVYAHIGDLKPSEVTYRHIEKIMCQPDLAGKRETLSRVRQRVQVILEYAAHREGEPHRYNPALSFKLPKRKPTDVRHHAHAPWQEVPAIMAALRLKRATTAMLLRFSILTAARSMEARGALWQEIDLDQAVWLIPAERMKARRPHRVPLSEEAVALLTIMAERKVEGSDRVFPGERGGLLSDVAINKTLHAIKQGVTAHGFRASFREWAAEATTFAREAVELCLAHTNPNRVEAAYQRSDLFEPRKAIMKSWADFCAGKSNVIELVPAANLA